MERSAARGGTPVRMGLAGASGAAAGSAETDGGGAETEHVAGSSFPPDSQEKKHSSVVRSVGEQMSFGGVLGFAAGYSIRKVGKAVLFLVGTEVVILQYMAYRQWLTMDWRRLAHDVAPRFNRSTWDGLVEILIYKMPFSAAFSGGLVAGLRVSSTK